MKNEYKHTKTTVSLINYHFVFCPRYRRKIFNIQGVEDRFKELTIAECEIICHIADRLATAFSCQIKIKESLMQTLLQKGNSAFGCRDFENDLYAAALTAYQKRLSAEKQTLRL